MKTSMRFSRGMTLIELLVVTIIVAILTAIAVPSYRSHTVRTHRAAARACLSEAAQFMERYYTSNMTYVGATIALGCETESDLDDRYTITVGDLAQRTYTLTPAPVGTQASHDTQCGTLSLAEDGTRGATGSGGLAKCW